MSRVTAYTEVDISEFDAVDILEEALEIMRRRTRGKDKKLETAIENIAGFLGREATEDELPPASTAAFITSMEALKNFRERTKT